MEENKKLYAGFWLRLLAYAIDRIILGVFGYGIGFVMGFIYVSSLGHSNGVQWVGNGIAIVMAWIYFAAFESSKYQATPGKRVIGIRVTNTAGNRISFSKATARHFSKILSWATIGIGFLMIAWTERRQGLHDKIAKTLVVKK